MRAEILPRARRDNRLPEPVYADNLRRVGVDMPPKLLMAQAQFSFTEIQHQMEAVALQVARQRGYASSDYRDVIRALKRNPTLTGKIVMHWTITAAGTVSGVDVEQDTLGDSEVGSCIKSLVARWRFPSPANGSVDVSFPFVFQSSQ